MSITEVLQGKKFQAQDTICQCFSELKFLPDPFSGQILVAGFLLSESSKGSGLESFFPSPSYSFLGNCTPLSELRANQQAFPVPRTWRQDPNIFAPNTSVTSLTWEVPSCLPHAPNRDVFCLFSMCCSEEGIILQFREFCETYQGTENSHSFKGLGEEVCLTIYQKPSNIMWLPGERRFSTSSPFQILNWQLGKVVSGTH